MNMNINNELFFQLHNDILKDQILIDFIGAVGNEAKDQSQMHYSPREADSQDDIVIIKTILF